MHPISRADLSDLDWIPFALSALALLVLRCAAIGNVRMLVDLAVMSGFVALFSMGRFIYKLYSYGHNLDPKAPFDVEPFTPAIFGEKQIANFHTASYPQLGSVLIGLFLTLVLGLTAWQLIKGRRDAVREDRLRAAPPIQPIPPVPPIPPIPPVPAAPPVVPEIHA